MKKLLLTLVCAGAMMVSAFAQLLDEKNVTITMDLQPVLQLSLEGPDQLDFTFDNINAYYAGIIKYGANVLRVSSSVSFDLWATGLSQTTNFLWDQVVDYPNGGGNATPTIPTSALELRQFPENPSVVTLGCAVTVGSGTGAGSDYNSAFAPYDIASNILTAGTSNNSINVEENTNPYTSPTSTATVATEKYIAGGTGTGSGCQIVGGSYLLKTNLALVDPASSAAGAESGYYFTIDYRILPGLPAKFPAFEDAATASTSADATAADAASSLDDGAATYAEPGVYTMYVKYILVEDQ